MDKVRRLCRTLASSLGGEVIATGTGVFAPDVAWASATGAEEVWIVYPQSKRCEFFAREGRMERSAFAVDLADIFK
jgi:threonine dehydrogenase-like Zn-dependent dehydrogenase